MKTLLALVLFFSSMSAYACTCPLRTQQWWESADAVALVRVIVVGVAAEDFLSGGTCTKSDPYNPCVLRQVASISTVETYKGNFQRTQLSSSYGSGSCGIPAVAGAYYVVFLRDKRDFQLSFCNAAGPYAPEPPYTRRNPKLLDPFLASLRAAARNPRAKVEPRPNPMGYNSEGGL